MRIAILSHFGSFQDGYALHVGWLERAKMLEYFGEDFDFLVNVRCKDAIVYPNVRPVLTDPKTSLPFNERVRHYEKLYLDVLKGYDAILTADLIYQVKGNFLPQNQAYRNVRNKLKARWFHWIHSGWTRRPYNLKYPESLRFTPPPASDKLVYMNTAEADGIAKMYNVHPERVACVYNPKDFRSFHNFHEFAWKISRQLDLPNKDAIQIFPHCSTRMDAKGIDAVIRVFAALKKSGKKVALIMANANARGVQAEIKAKKDFMKSLGLEENKDFLFTSDWTSNRPLPRAAVANLFLVSNLFVFASWREVCPNVLLEGEISGNLLAINAMNPALPEFAGENHIKFTADAKTPGVPDGVSGDLTRIEYHSGEERYFDWIAAIIGDHLPDRSYQWAYSYEKIWETQMRPLLYGGIGGDRKEAA